MSKAAASLSVLTANRLSDGVVVVLDVDGVWVESLRGAAEAHSPEQARALEARGAADAARNFVVDPYLVEMQDIDGLLVPLRIRERVRLAGPSILDDVPGYVGLPSPRLPGQRHPDLPMNGERETHAEAA